MTGRVVLTEAMVVPATGAPPFEGWVVVEDGRIADVVEGTGAYHGNGDVAPLGGRSLLPGLIDAHVHVTAVDVDPGEQSRHRFPSEVALLAGRELEQMLARGFTTVRDAGGADAGLRGAVERGIVQGPRLLVSGRPLSQTGGHGDFRAPAETALPEICGNHVGLESWVTDGTDGVRRAAREELRRGADQVKIMASGGVLSLSDKLESVQYSPEELAAAVTAARAVGTYVLAHAYTPATIRACIEAGVRSIEHGNLLDEPTAALMAEHGTYLVPTLVTYEALHRDGERQGLSRGSLEKLERVVDAGLESLRIAAAAGVKIASGSDLLGDMRAHQGREIAIKASALSPMDAVVAATRTSAELLGLDDRIGTVEPGKEADLVVVDGDVLQDPGLAGRPETTSLVMRSGRIVHRTLAP